MTRAVNTHQVNPGWIIPSNINFQPHGGPYGNSLIGQGLDTTFHLQVYYYSTNLCVDCTYNDGTTVKPSYWP